jgi:hypothetical protein
MRSPYHVNEAAFAEIVFDAALDAQYDDRRREADAGRDRQVLLGSRRRTPQVLHSAKL